jgi:hypothetical protein
MEAKVMKTVTWRLMPFLVLLHLIAYADRSNVGFAKLTLQDELGLSNAAFTFGQVAFFVAYAIFEVPAVLRRPLSGRGIASAERAACCGALRRGQLLRGWQPRESQDIAVGVDDLQRRPSGRVRIDSGAYRRVRSGEQFLLQRGHVAHRDPDRAVGAAIAVVLGEVQHG